ncbi:DUF2357 domain-containing protein [Kallotenue papyrolyticum]|uniref:DUF2357 domain-containing protein n=1 Tax=Kallotenue papyrolyticum TaxID=1325125 RepID=UPI00047201D2|nr:DUF2357 domain-containing protein [Kallotenue papyrolyticum]
MSGEASITINGQALDQALPVAGDFYEWEPLEIAYRPAPGVRTARLVVGTSDLGLPLARLGDDHWRWHWRAPQAVGLFDARLQLGYADGGERELAFALRVVPRKIDLERYEALVSALQHDVYGLVYALGEGRQGAAWQPGAATRSLIEAYVLLVEQQAREAVAVAEAIAARPHTRLTAREEQVALAAAERLEPAALARLDELEQVEAELLPALQQRLRAPRSRRGGLLPRAVALPRTASTLDLPEHRLLKQALRTVLWRLELVRDLARREATRRRRAQALGAGAAAVAVAEVWVARCRAAQRQVRRALTLPLLAEVSDAGAPLRLTHLMQRDARYRRLWRLLRALQGSLLIAFDSPLLWLPLHDLPTLYEQWCAVQVIRAVLRLGAPVEQRLVLGIDGEPQRRWLVRLRPHQPLLRVRCADGLELAVCYQRRYAPNRPETLGALDPFARIPDVAVEVTRGDETRVLVFDAKYRVTEDGGVPQDALDEAYAYRGAIGRRGARATLGAFLLYPGAATVLLDDQVGALPLLPGREELLAPLIERLIADAT